MTLIRNIALAVALLAGIIIATVSTRTADASHAPVRCIHALELADELHYAYEQLFWAAASQNWTRVYQEAQVIDALRPQYQSDRNACRS